MVEEHLLEMFAEGGGDGDRPPVLRVLSFALLLVYEGNDVDFPSLGHHPDFRHGLAQGIEKVEKWL